MKTALLLAFLAQDPADEKPNLLFILTDDHRPDGMGCYGNRSLRTPNFDRIASEGARFDAFYVAAPLCCPSRAAILSGLYPHENGVMNNRNSPDLRRQTATVATMLNEAGYATGFVGKAHMGGDPRAWGFRETPVWLPTGGARHANPLLMVEGVQKQVPGQITQIFADAAITWLEKHKTDRWFLWLATTAPHTPYVRDPKHPYEREKIEPPPLWPKGEPLSDADWEGYYSTISMLDEQIGRVLAKLQDLGQLDRTLIVVIGDNGFMHGSHGHKAKSVWWEESARVPAIARWPGKIKPGTVVSTPCVSVDLMPTFAEAGGAKAPAGREGRSLLPALTGAQPLRTVAYSEVQAEREGGHWQLVRTAKFKYVRFSAGGREMLFDLEKDPNEKRDVVADPGYAKALEEMRAFHKEWAK